MKILYKALAEFQQEVPAIFKDTQAYGYKYANLSNILEVINPLMKKNGLGFTQIPNQNDLKTVVFHFESGECIESSITIPTGVQLKGMNDFQIMGSGLTYLRRYALSSMLGLVTDVDSDGTQVAKKDVATTKPIFTEANFEKAKTANATIEKIKSVYSITQEVEANYLKFLTNGN